MRRTGRVLLGLMAVAAAGACGGLGTVDTTSTVGIDGGLVESDDGKATVDVPPGAVDEDRDVTVDAGEDGGYVLGPADLELDEPVKVRIGSDEPGLPVRIGADGEPHPLDEPTVTAGPDGYTAVGSTTDAGTFTTRAETTDIDLTPEYLTVNVGDQFRARASLYIIPRPGDDRAAHEAQLADYRASGEAGAVPLGQRVASHAWTVLDALRADIDLEFRCELPGRWSFGFDSPGGAPGARGSSWRTSVVECVDASEADRFETGLGEPADTTLDDEDPPPVPTDGPPAIAVGELGAALGPALRPAEITAAVGDTFSVSASVVDSGRTIVDAGWLQDDGAGVPVRVRAVAEGPVALPIADVVETTLAVDSLYAVPVARVDLGFVCVESGVQAIGAVFTVDLRPAGGPEATVEASGNVTCTDDGGPPEDDGGRIPRIRLNDGGVWLPGGYVSEQGVKVRLLPSAFVAEIWESVVVDVEISLLGGQPGFFRRISVKPDSGPRSDVLGHSDSWQRVVAEDGGRVVVPVVFQCRREGSTGYGARVVVSSEQFDDGFATTPVGEAPGFRGGLRLGTAACVDHGPGIPPVGWQEELLQSGDGHTAGDATYPATLQGPCQGRAMIDGYGTIDPASSGGVYTVPRTGAAKWFGAIAAVPGEERSHSGFVKVHLPRPFPAVTIDSWSDVTTEVHNQGETSWDLNPLWTPGGVQVVATGEHRDTAGTCRAHVMVRFAGGLFSSAVGPFGLGLAVFAGGLLLTAGYPKD